MTVSGPPKQNNAAQRLSGLRQLIIALIIFGLSIALNLTQPVWFAPPWIRYTSLVYVLLMLAWWPWLGRGLRLLVGGRRRVFMALIGFIILTQCCLGMTFAPLEFGYLLLYNGAHPVLGGSFECDSGPLTQVETLRCELCIVSSDDPLLTSRQYEFKRRGAAPFMRLINLQERDDRDPNFEGCKGEKDEG